MFELVFGASGDYDPHSIPAWDAGKASSMVGTSYLSLLRRLRCSNFIRCVFVF